jgi:hypothetical protein
MSQLDYNRLIHTIYQELIPQHIGQLTYNTAIARKPLA